MQVTLEKFQTSIKNPLVRKTLTVLQLLSGAIFIAVKLKLPTPPSTFPFYPLTSLLLIVFYACLLLSSHIDSIDRPRGTFTRRVIVVVILSIGLTAFIYSNSPVSKTRLEAESFTQTQRTAVATGNEAATSVKKGETTETEILDRISQKYKENPEAKRVAEESFQKSISSNKTPGEVMQELLPTVPVKVGEWTCNSSGCSYADQEFVWTTTNSNRAITSALIVFTITLLFWVANGDFISKLVRAEEVS